MSIKLEILDYNFSALSGTQIITNEEFAYTGGGWNVGYSSCPPNGGWYITANRAYFCSTPNYTSRILRNTDTTGGTYFQAGKRYKIEYKIGYSGTPTSGGSNFLRLLGHSTTALPSGGFGDIILNTSAGTHTTEWTQGASSASQIALRILCGNGFNGYLSYVKVYPLTDISWQDSVVGELDVGNHVDFPLALTFQISDIKDITSTSGTFSKTFKIPATKNNNKLLKNFYDSKSTYNNNLSNLKSCRILVNNLYSLNGLIKITGAGGFGERASYYDCVFYGNNMSWASLMEEKSLSEIDWGTDIDTGTPLECNVYEIKGAKGWEQTDCTSNASHITYPITSYGDFNPTGQETTVQFLFTKSEFLSNTGTASTGKNGYYGCNNISVAYATPLPTADWRPAIWVKDTIDKIFNNLGYQINSNFMNTDMFKKLVWLLPNAKYNNPSERASRYSFEARLGTGDIPLINASSSVTELRFPSSGTFNNAGTDNYVTKSVYFEIEDSSTAIIDNYGCGQIGNCDPTTGTGWGTTTFGYRNSNGNFYVPEYGYYTINFKDVKVKCEDLQYNGTNPNDYHLHDFKVQLGVWVLTVGESGWAYNNSPAKETHAFNPHEFAEANSTAPADEKVKENTFNFSITTWLNKGDRVLPYAKTIHNRQHAPSNGSHYDFNIRIYSPTGEGKIQYIFNPDYLEWGQSFDLAKLINTEYKQIDFIKGIAHSFNLKISTDETSRQVTIEPYNDFYKTYAQALDWTHKLDRSKTSQFKELKTGLKRQIQFNYKEDSKDGKVEAMGNDYFNGIPDVFPYQESLDNSFDKGLEVYENPFFSGTACGRDRDIEGTNTNGTAATISAKNALLWECNNDINQIGRCDKGFEYKPRLLFWNKYSPNATYDAGHTRAFKVEMWAGHTKQISANSNSSDLPNPLFPIYPQATSYNRFDPDSPNLCYGNITAQAYDENDGSLSGSEIAVKGLFETYYNFMVEQFKAKPRIQTSFFDIKITDIVNLDFGKLIYIDGCYWRLNKIIDFQPHINSPTKVELVEWVDVGTFAASPPPVIAPSIIGDNPNPFNTQ